MNEPEQTYAIRLHRYARLDIDAAEARLAEFAGTDVDTWRNGLFDALASLATKPRRCALAREDTLFVREVRVLLYRRTRHSSVYRVLFTVYESRDEAPFVYVLAVKHGAQGPMTAEDAQAIEDDR